MAVPAATPPIQHGGHLDATRQNLQAWLHSANSGTTHFAATRWWQSCWKWWVIDVTHFDQRQRINGGAEFMRTAGTVALYRPNLRFEEWQKKGGSAQESWVLFTASGQMLRALHDLTGRGGYCHFQDPEAAAPSRIVQISRELFYRRSGFQWHAQAAFLDLLALLVTSKPIAPRLHVIRTNQDLPAGGRSSGQDGEVHSFAHLRHPERRGSCPARRTGALHLRPHLPQAVRRKPLPIDHPPEAGGRQATPSAGAPFGQRDSSPSRILFGIPALPLPPPWTVVLKVRRATAGMSVRKT